MKPGTRHTASHSEGAATTGHHSAGRRSKVRAPCHVQATAAIRKALPTPSVRKFSIEVRSMKMAAVMLAHTSAAPHHMNHVEVLFFIQKAANSAPSKSFTNSANSKTVNE